MTKIKAAKWSPYAKKDVRSIKKFFDRRNKSPIYSNKLIRLFRQSAAHFRKHPLASIETEYVRGYIVQDYILFFLIENEEIIVLRVWDTRRNPDLIEHQIKRKPRS